MQYPVRSRFTASKRIHALAYPVLTAVSCSFTLAFFREARRLDVVFRLAGLRLVVVDAFLLVLVLLITKENASLYR